MATDKPTRRFLDEIKRMGANVDPVAGFFGPDSVSWRISRESILFLGSMRALMLQLAHPFVAQAVFEHSKYKEDPLGRGLRTFDAVFKVLYGSRDTAIKAAARIYAVHDRIRGVLPVATPQGPAGTPYYGLNPEALLWVHATLVDGAVQTYEMIYGPLGDATREAYWRESIVFARLFGVPPAVIPETWSAFIAWRDHMLQERLTVIPAAREVGDTLIHARGIYRPIEPANIVLAAGMLPPKFRAAFGLPWTTPVRAAFQATIALARRTQPRLHPRLRYLPAWHAAMARIRKAERAAA